MPYTRVSRTKNGREAIVYAFGNNNEGHNGNEIRNKFISTVNLLPEADYADQMERHWNKARKNHKTQVLRIVQSFSAKEFDPGDPKAIATANQIGVEMVKEHYKDRQAVIFTQKDGVGGLIHNHIIVNDVSITEHKGCDKIQYFTPKLRDWSNEITNRYIQLDNSAQTATEKTTQTEWAKREKGEYVMKDDIRSRVTAAMLDCSDEDDFLKQLTLYGIEAERKTSKKYGEYFTYQLTDFSNAPDGFTPPNNNAKVRSYKLGTNYSVEKLREMLSEKQKSKPITAAKSSLKRVDIRTVEEKKKANEETREFQAYPNMPKSNLQNASDDPDLPKHRTKKKTHKLFLPTEPTTPPAQQQDKQTAEMQNRNIDTIRKLREDKERILRQEKRAHEFDDLLQEIENMYQKQQDRQL